MVRVLIADDHAMVREGLHWALEHAGYEVVGEAAVELTEDLRPDIVLMDLSLPVLSGVAATKRIRSLVPTTKVVVLSMLSDETAVSSALAAGAVGYLVKDSTTPRSWVPWAMSSMPPPAASCCPRRPRR